MSGNAPKQSGRYNLDDYVTVSERIERFYEKHHDGRIITNLVEINHETGFVLMQAMVYRTSADPHPAATGHAYEVRGESYINKNSYIENCETGAVGRALALLGFEVRRGLSSREEMDKSARMTPAEAAAGERGKPVAAPPPAKTSDAVAAPVKADKAASEEQKEEILNLLQRERPGDRRAQQKLLMEMTGKSSREELTEPDAVRLIEQLKKGKPSLASNSKP